jgi:hypothetical protein
MGNGSRDGASEAPEDDDQRFDAKISPAPVAAVIDVAMHGRGHK